MSSNDIVAKNRFESFKLGKGLPSTAPLGGPPRHAHTRSHSRNNSVSNSVSSFTFPLSSAQKSTTTNDMSHFSFPPQSPVPFANHTPAPAPNANPAPAPVPSTKRNSHHRRRSSVSTRHESAELMGMSLPDLPPSISSDDNINLGEKDSIRRRALWALEGKPDVSFNKVEIPELSTPDMEKLMFDFPTKPSYPAGSNSSYGSGLGSLTSGGKRDSFKLLGASASAKDQLHTLVEEEEEEEEELVQSPKAQDTLPSPTSSIKENLPPPNTPITPAVAVTKPTPSKPRPATLNLRPLALTPANLTTAVQGLPTPSLTPSPRTGLRSLSLSPSPALDDSIEIPSKGKRSSLIISPTPAPRRPILNLAMDHFETSSVSSTPESDSQPARRSSISYKRSSYGNGVATNIAGLPTPEMTPTFSRRYSHAESLGNTSGDDEFFPNPPTQSRPLSASEQHFLFKSHNALLARITDLERALSVRRRESGGYSNGGSSRPLSGSSNFSSSSDVGSGNGEPSDEMLNLITDLKAERDELKRDVDGWRTRVENLENQVGVFAKRVENERRDAWVARSRVGLLEVEKGVLAKRLEAVDQLIALHDKEKALLDGDRRSLRKENESLKKRVGVLEEELEKVKSRLEMEMAKTAKLSDPLATPTARAFDGHARLGLGLNKKHGLGFMSVDSESSSTDVDPDSSDDNIRFALKVVQEESDGGEEDDEYCSEEENALAGYEDEDDTDIGFQSSSSFGSEDEFPRSTNHLQHVAPSSPTTPRPMQAQVFTPPRPTHVSRATLSKTWTFPKGIHTQVPIVKKENDDTVDRFFGCLDDGESSSGSAPNSPSAYSYEKSKGVFASGFKFAPADDNASFFLPDGVGMPAEDEDEDETRLSVVDEDVEDGHDDAEEEEEMDGSDDMFGEIGGIRIIFTPPQEEPEVKEKKQLQVSPVKRTSPPPVLPALDFGDEEEEEQEEVHAGIPFNFGRPLVDERQASSPAAVAVAVPVMITPPSSLPRSGSPSINIKARPASPSVSVNARPASPSMIPRPASPSAIPRSTTTWSSFSDCTSSTPPKLSSIRAIAPPVTFAASSYITPPTKRGGAVPSFIPQPVSSPSPMRVMAMPAPAPVSVKPRVVPTSTFIRQPTRKPLLPSGITNSKAQKQSSMGSSANANGSTLIPQLPVILPKVTVFRRSSDDHPEIPGPSFNSYSFGGNNSTHSSAQMKSVDLSNDRDAFGKQQQHTHTRPHPHPRSSVSSTASSSISSIMNSPLTARLSFQTFTNFIPLSWGPRSGAGAPAPPVSVSAAAPSVRVPKPSFDAARGFGDDAVVVVGPVAAATRKGGYVSREKQLRVLRARMEVEGAGVMREAVNVQCKKCDGELVFI